MTYGRRGEMIILVLDEFVCSDKIVFLEVQKGSIYNIDIILPTDAILSNVPDPVGCQLHTVVVADPSPSDWLH
jgi:hypothetical protein